MEPITNPCVSVPCLVQRGELTFAQLAKRKPFLNTSRDRTVSVGDKKYDA